MLRSFKFLWTFVAVVVFGSLFAFYIQWTTAFNSIRRESSVYLLARLAPGAERQPTPSLHDANTLRTALLAQPLSPIGWNARFFLETEETDRIIGARWKILDRLGWRNTVMLQNRIVLAAQAGRFDEVADIADALLRRRELVAETTALLNLMELAPQQRPLVIEKLGQNPVWADDYLKTVDPLVSTQAIKARADVVGKLMQRSDVIDRSIIGRVSNKLVASDMVPDGLKLWRRFFKLPPSLINDPSFNVAWRMRASPDDASPFEWSLPSGFGFWGETVLEAGDSAVRLNWDGRGVPVLLTQITGAPAGSYALELEGSDFDRDILRRFSFVLRCKNASYIFDKIVKVSDNRALLKSTDALSCANPAFQVTGDINSDGLGVAPGAVGGSKQLSLTLSKVQLVAP